MRFVELACLRRPSQVGGCDPRAAFLSRHLFDEFLAFQWPGETPLPELKPPLSLLAAVCFFEFIPTDATTLLSAMMDF